MMNAKTKEALEGSIKKWERIARNTEAKDIGPNNCTLCIMYLDIECDSCPVAIKTGKTSCQASPHTLWVRHQDEEHHDYNFNEFGDEKRNYYHRQKGCKTCLSLAKEELAFLESLREK